MPDTYCMYIHKYIHILTYLSRGIHATHMLCLQTQRIEGVVIGYFLYYNGLCVMKNGLLINKPKTKQKIMKFSHKLYCVPWVKKLS